jgi:RNA polymerase sigma-70 factor (ECF subfamily)
MQPKIDNISALFISGLEGDKRKYQKFMLLATSIARAIVCRKAGMLPKADQEDIVQDILLAIHSKRATWKTNMPVKPWIYAIARYKIVDRFRIIGRDQFVEFDEQDFLIAPESALVESAYDQNIFVSRLKGKQSEIIKKILKEGKSFSDIATEMSMTNVAIRVNFHRAITKLRTWSKEESN